MTRKMIALCAAALMLILPLTSCNGRDPYFADAATGYSGQM